MDGSRHRLLLILCLHTTAGETYDLCISIRLKNIYRQIIDAQYIALRDDFGSVYPEALFCIR